MDWRGHGGSGSSEGDFGFSELVADALAVIAASGAERVVPVATAHAGWVAIELRRRLGDRVSKLVLVDWIVTDPPPPFLGALSEMQDPSKALQIRDRLFAMWTEGVEHTGVLRFVREDMGSYAASMWARAAREIAAAYSREGNPLRALAALAPPPPVLHLYAQPADSSYLAAQQAFAVEYLWFAVRRLDARSHFATIEVPKQMQDTIERFVAATSAIQRSVHGPTNWGFLSRDAATKAWVRHQRVLGVESRVEGTSHEHPDFRRSQRPGDPWRYTRLRRNASPSSQPHRLPRTGAHARRVP